MMKLDHTADLGLVGIRESKPIDLTEFEVIKSFGSIKIVALESAPERPRALDDIDLATIRGISRSTAD